MALRRSVGFLNKLGGIKTNQVSNGDFTTNTTGWTATDATLSVAVGELEITETGGTNPGKAYQDFATIAGRVYMASVDFTKGTADSGSVLIGDNTNDDAILTSPALSDATKTQHQFVFIADGASTRITLQTNDADAGETSLFDNVSVHEVSNGYGDIFHNCKISIYTGAQPASANAAASGTLLYTLTSNGDGTTGLTWEQSVGGVVAKKADESWKGTALATGTAGWFRVYENGDDPSQASTLAARWDGAIATSGSEADMTNTAVESGAVQTCTAFTYTQPAS